jgi:hypothetical protein
MKPRVMPTTVPLIKPMVLSRADVYTAERRPSAVSAVLAASL